jgi:hypothetical protein
MSYFCGVALAAMKALGATTLNRAGALGAPVFYTGYPLLSHPPEAVPLHVLRARPRGIYSLGVG